MPYKRLIFTLHYDSGLFCLSRNFRLQKVGNIKWLLQNYDLKSLCSALDELIILNVSRKTFAEKYNKTFYSAIDQVLANCFCPVSIGGGIRTIDHARELMSSGADKIILCSSLYHDINLAPRIADLYGSQAVTAWFDYSSSDFMVDSNQTEFTFSQLERNLPFIPGSIGDVVLHSINKDGTGTGFDLETFHNRSHIFSGHPLIISGGAGKSSHFAEVFASREISGASTANVLNFIGSDMQRVRRELITSGFSLASWN